MKLSQIPSALPSQHSEVDSPVMNAEQRYLAKPSIPLENSAYCATIQIGSPAKDFRLVLDTSPDGSASWVFSKQCQSIACFLHATYDHDASSTYKANGSSFASQFLGSDVKGVLSQDTVQVGGLKVASQTFGEVTSISNPISMATAKPDGVLGLGSAKAAGKDTPAVLQSLINLKLLDEPVMSIYLSSNNLTSSEAMFGGINKEHYKGSLTRIPLTKSGFWEVGLGSIGIGDDVTELDPGSSALFSSGYVGIATPGDIAEYLNTVIGGKRGFDGLYRVDCSKVSSLPTVRFKLGGQAFPLGPSDYIASDEQRGCVSAFRPSGVNKSGKEFFALGQAFMRKWYSVFDLGKQEIGLAEAK